MTSGRKPAGEPPPAPVAPGYTTPEAPPELEACAACDQPVSAAVPGGFWMIDGAPHHTACVDWTKRSFPYRWAIDAAERACRRLAREGVADDELARALAWLRGAAARWPGADPPRTLVSAARAAAVITARAEPSSHLPRELPPASLSPATDGAAHGRGTKSRR